MSILELAPCHLKVAHLHAPCTRAVTLNEEWACDLLYSLQSWPGRTAGRASRLAISLDNMSFF
eukprot:3367613-Amphidinium_carterae.2